VSRPVAGFLLGVTAVVIFVAVTTPFAGSDTSLWWWPAVLAFGAICGGVIGALFGAESAGEPPEEGYDGPDQKTCDAASGDSRPRIAR
jgi:hypothetical protein